MKYIDFLNFLFRWTILQSLSSLLSSAEDNFYFSVQPSDQDVVEGRSATLNCMVSNSDSITFYWQLDGVTIQNTTRRFQVGSDLHITRASREKDVGDFTCIAMNTSTGFSISSLAAVLNIQWLDEDVTVQLLKPHTPEAITVQNEVLLRCKADGSPEIQYEWFRNGIMLEKSDKFSIKHKRLHIHNVDTTDNGVYSCKVTNPAGQKNSIQNFPLRVTRENSVRITVMPEDVVVNRYDNTRFDCAYSMAAVTEWYFRNDGPLQNSTRYIIYPNGSLAIKKVESPDEGQYSCVGVQGGDSDEPAQSYVASLKLSSLSDMTGALLEPKLEGELVRVAPEGQRFEVTCLPPDGYPSPKLWWEDGNSHIIPDIGHIRVEENSLVIQQAQQEDSGNYTCLSQNMAGIKRLTINLFVSVRPVVTSEPMNIMVDEDDPVILTCQYAGLPYPISRISWYHHGNLIRDDSWHFVMDHENGTLRIKSVKLQDNGTYLCSVNTSGFPPVQAEVASVHVKEKLKFTPPPVSKKLELGSQAKVYCKARGATAPIVKWIKETDSFRSLEWPEHIRDDNGTLYIEGVQQEDAGQYTCVATSTQGIINATIKLEVIVSPKFILKPQEVTEAMEGFSILIPCVARGDPSPTIQWDKNSVLNGFDSSRFHVMQNGSLLISEVHVQDGGKYGCTAGNSGGFNREEFVLRVISSEGDLGLNSPSDETRVNVMTKTVTITLSAAAGYMILVVGLMVWCRYRRLKRKQMNLQTVESTGGSKIENGERKVKEQTELQEGPQTGGGTSEGEAATSPRGKPVINVTYSRQELQRIMLLGKGHFGEVFLAKTGPGKGPEKDQPIVMVKALQTKDEYALSEFKRELDLYQKISHQRITKVLNVCRDADPHLVVMEYTNWGDLKQFLLATRKDGVKKTPQPPPLTVPQIMGMVQQIIEGMEYLSNHRYLHRDLATRNCLISSNLDIKLSNPCLSKDTYAKEYYTYRNQSLPIRWMSPEAVLEDEYSIKSEVWAFSCTVWELFNQAELPLNDSTDPEVIHMLSTEKIKWEAPNDAPDSLKELMTRCWSINPRERPSFSEINAELSHIDVNSEL